MRERLWGLAHTIAADLVVHHHTLDGYGNKKHPIGNELEKTTHHVINNASGFDDVLNWLYTRMAYANYFERSKQTIRQLAIVYAVIDKLKDTVREDEFARVLGWIARLMKYYAEYEDEARPLVNRYSSFVPEPPPLEPAKKPTVPVKVESMLRPESEETRKVAEDIFSQLQKRWQKTQEDDDAEEQHKLRNRHERRRRK